MHITGHVVIKTTAMDILTTPNFLKWTLHLFIRTGVAMSTHILSFDVWCTTFVWARKRELQTLAIVCFSDILIRVMERAIFTLVWSEMTF